MIATEEHDTRDRLAAHRQSPDAAAAPSYPPPPSLSQAAGTGFRRTIKSYPLVALTAALTVGVLIGCLVKRR